MKQRLWAVAPWCLLAVLFFSGAGESEKPVPKYMQLMLLEERMQTDLLQLMVREQAASAASSDSQLSRIASELAAHSYILTLDESKEPTAGLPALAKSGERAVASHQHSVASRELRDTLANEASRIENAVQSGWQSLDKMRSEVFPGQ